MVVELKYIEIEDLKLHAALAGPEDGVPIILLHGFPDAWFSWESQISTLTTEGFRVIAPDQRGYNRSDKPRGKENYRMELLVKDILGLAEKLNLKTFHLVGHDFGAMVAWWIAIYYPERVASLVISNVPHPKIMNDFLRSHFSQMRKSWYTFFFKIPIIPEKILRVRNWKFLSTAMAKGLSKEQRDRYRDAWSQPNAITSMINWYRAFGKKFSTKARSLKVDIPTLILWGKKDPHLSYEMAKLSVDMCTDCKLITFENASHWVHQDDPEEYNKCLISFLKGKR